jgi:hypothetical protein
VDEASEVEQTPEVGEDNSNALEDGVVNRAIIMIPVEAGVVHAVDDDLAGKTTTNPSAIATLPSTSNLTGRCWRRLISTAWLS